MKRRREEEDGKRAAALIREEGSLAEEEDEGVSFGSLDLSSEGLDFGGSAAKGSGVAAMKVEEPRVRGEGEEGADRGEEEAWGCSIVEDGARPVDLELRGGEGSDGEGARMLEAVASTKVARRRGSAARIEGAQLQRSSARVKAAEDLKRVHSETDILQRIAKKRKIIDMVDDGGEESEQKCLEGLKKSEDGGETRLEITFSVSDIKQNYKDATLLPNWKSFRTVIFRERDDGLHDSEKIAAFDFDGCLANTSVNRTGADAWSLMYPSIPAKLQELYDNGYKLVIFTNESNIERWKNKRQQAVDSKIGRLDKFISRVKVPIQVFIACGLGKNKDLTEDPFRKPKPGMWQLLEEHFNSGIAIDMDKSFYVGDAAGRRNDHSNADIKFAEAIGLKFHLPEDFFGA